MTESNDRMLADWLHEGPESGPREGLERALAATRRVGQRPGWTLPERWIPMQMTLARTWSPRPIVTIVVLALLLVVLAASALFIGRLQSPPFRNGAVVYAAEGNVNADQLDLFIADQLGGPARPLVPGPDSDSNPAFSPQGDRVAFIRDQARIMTVNPDGSDVTELANPGAVVRLDWSPDGSALLASTFSLENLQALTVVQSDGSGSRTLDLDGIYTVSGAWRPNGQHIAFVGYQAGDLATFIADADGTNVRYVGIGPESSEGAEWSPDGKHLGFLSPDGISIADITEEGDVAGLHQLALDLDPESTPRTDPKWSPDGSQLAFAVGPIGRTFRAAIADADGSGLRLVGQADIVTDGQGRLRPLDFTWSPDGRSLIIGAWSVDVATGEQTEVGTPVESWQRLAP